MKKSDSEYSREEDTLAIAYYLPKVRDATVAKSGKINKGEMQ